MGTPIITLLITVATGLTTFLAFRDSRMFDRWLFRPRDILVGKQYHRLVSSAFIHVDWVHYGFNFFSFYSFGGLIEHVYGPGTLLLLYFASIIGGGLLSLLLHRNHDYTAVGASGGVCGVIFASIFLLPGGGVELLFIPIPIPSWLFAIVFLVGSFFALRHGKSRIGHDAHIGGAIAGLLVTTLWFPRIVFLSPWLFVATLGISVFILIFLLGNPFSLNSAASRRIRRSESFFAATKAQEYQAAEERIADKEELNRLLDKVSEKGMHSLSATEKRRLEVLSNSISKRR